jgi:hypothetical protein
LDAAKSSGEDVKEIKIAGFSSDLTPGDKPTVSVYGQEGSGKTRFAATAPGPIGLLPLDRKSKRTFEIIAKTLNTQVVIPKTDYMKPSDLISISLLDSEDKESLGKVKKHYSELVKRVMEDAMKLADHPEIQSIVVDSNTQFWDWIMFSHFGRRNQVETFQRGAPNQDMIDFINALKHKNLVLLHRAAEVWKDTGEIDKNGKKKQGPTGKFKAEGCSKLGYLITCEIEMVDKAKAETLDDKFKVRIRECQNNPLMEGVLLDEYGVMGESITWDNLMTAIGWAE